MMEFETIPLSAYACIGLISVVLSYVAISESVKDAKESSSYTSMLPNIMSPAPAAAAPAANANAPAANAANANASAANASANANAAPTQMTGGKRTSKRNSKKHKHKKSGKHHSKHR